MNLFELRAISAACVSILYPGKPNEGFMLLLILFKGLIATRTFKWYPYPGEVIEKM